MAIWNGKPRPDLLLTTERRGDPSSDWLSNRQLLRCHGRARYGQARQRRKGRKRVPESLDCFVAFAPRNDDKGWISGSLRASAKHPAILMQKARLRVSATRIAPGFGSKLPRWRGRREYRALDAPAAARV